MEAIKSGIRSWLRVTPATSSMITIQETLDYDGNAIKNRIWYRGDGMELEQLYKQIPGCDTRFWAARTTPGMEIRKIHVGMPAMIADTLANIVVADMGKITLKQDQETWDIIEKENKFSKLVSKAVTEALYIGDGAFKISFDPNVSEYPILEFYPGDRIEINYNRGRVNEIVFKTQYISNKQEYVLLEVYGHRYIKYQLTKNGKEVPLNSIPETEKLADVSWNDNFMMAVPMMFYESSKWEGRGKSIYDTKTDAFDSLDEAWSQWMDALRANRTKEYIPDCMVPRNPKTGEVLAPNAFDNRYIKTDSPMIENGTPKIETEQGTIPHESYLATYITALDLCLQGIISPSTLGIDTKKLDNAEATREKEKATLYTRNNILDELPGTLEELINSTMKAFATYNEQPVKEMEVEVPFGEYANPSFESQVETVGKAKTQGIMSIEATVDELYGDSKDEEWKAEEVSRLKVEQGIAEIDQLGINSAIDI